MKISSGERQRTSEELLGWSRSGMTDILVAFPCVIFLDLGSLCPIDHPQEVAFAPARGVTAAFVLLTSLQIVEDWSFVASFLWPLWS